MEPKAQDCLEPFDAEKLTDMEMAIHFVQMIKRIRLSTKGPADPLEECNSLFRLVREAADAMTNPFARKFVQDQLDAVQDT